MTDTINIHGVRVGPAEARILALYGADLDSQAIIERTGEAPGIVSRILGSIPGGGRAGAARMLAAWLTRTGWDARPQPDREPAPEPATTVVRTSDAISDLISRAVATERPKLVALADRVNDLADALEQQLTEHERAAELQAEAAKLEARLAEIRAQLPTAVPGRRRADPLAYDPKAVRVWAAAHGMHCPKVGRVPAAIVTAYQHAQAGAQ